jgi:transposase
VEKDAPLAAWLKVLPTLNEAQTRWYVAQKALEVGRGGIQRVHELTGISRPTIIKGLRELREQKRLDASERLRRPGGGRKKIETVDPGVVGALERILDENTAGDPMSLLKWTGKSARRLADEVGRLGHSVGADTVCRLLHDLGYTLQANRKTKEGPSHPDRDTQFRYLNQQVKGHVRRGQPVISVDTKKKERVGEFKNPGRTWRKRGVPAEVNVYDYPDLGIGVAVPYGTYDVKRNEGLVNVGTNHDTAEFAVESIRQWWRRFGRRHYPRAKKLLIAADGGGSNGNRNRAWRFHLQRFSDETGLAITVCHYPPGTSKWNKIEHRMFSFISLNWKGQPLVSYETVVNLIGTTTTRTGLRVKARLDRRQYQSGVKVPKKEMEQLRIIPHGTLPRWNYTIRPRPKVPGATPS